MPWFHHSLWIDIRNNPDSTCQPGIPHQPCHSVLPPNTHIVSSSARSTLPRFFSTSIPRLFLLSQAWMKWLNNKRCLPWPNHHPLFPRREEKKKKDPSSSHIPVSCPICVVHMLFPWDSHEDPVAPHLIPHHSAGIKEIGGVELLSWIRHGQCSLGWAKPPEGKSARGWIEWKYGGNMHPWSCQCLSCCYKLG